MTLTKKKKDNPFGFDAEPNNELYLGWANYETYNAAGILIDDLYRVVTDFVQLACTGTLDPYKGPNPLISREGTIYKTPQPLRYANFVSLMQEYSGRKTFGLDIWPTGHSIHGVNWTDEKLNHAELDAMLEEIASDDFELEEYTMVAFNGLDKTPIHSRDWRAVFEDNPLYIPEED
jgi:hypothetical protein